MTEDAQPQIKTSFQQEHSIESKKPSVFHSSNSIPAIDELQIMDLDAFNYISAKLYDGAGVAEDNIEDLDASSLEAMFKRELLKNPRLFDTIGYPELLSASTLKRLNIALALLAIDEVATLRSQNESQNETEDEQSLEAKNYISNKQMATCYRKLVTVLCSDSLALSDKADDIVITLLFFLSELAAGQYVNGSYSCFVTEQAQRKLDSILSLNSSEATSFDERTAEKIKQDLEHRRAEVIKPKQLLQAIESGELNMEPAAALAAEQTLLKCLQTVFVTANNESMPVLHPNYHAESSLRLKTKVSEFVQNIRQIRRQQTKGFVASPRKPVSKRARSISGGSLDSERKESRRRTPWTDLETDALEKGLIHRGTDWVQIKRDYADILSSRDPVALKDRARTVRAIKERNGEPLGVWDKACKPTAH